MNIHRFVCGFSVKSEIKPANKEMYIQSNESIILSWSRINECDEDDGSGKEDGSIIFIESCSTLSLAGLAAGNAYLVLFSLLKPNSNLPCLLISPTQTRAHAYTHRITITPQQHAQRQRAGASVFRRFFFILFKEEEKKSTKKKNTRRVWDPKQFGIRNGCAKIWQTRYRYLQRVWILAVDCGRCGSKADDRGFRKNIALPSSNRTKVLICSHLLYSQKRIMP